MFENLVQESPKITIVRAIKISQNNQHKLYLRPEVLKEMKWIKIRLITITAIITITTSYYLILKIFKTIDKGSEPIHKRRRGREKESILQQFSKEIQNLHLLIQMIKNKYMNIKGNPIHCSLTWKKKSSLS